MTDKSNDSSEQTQITQQVFERLNTKIQQEEAVETQSDIGQQYLETLGSILREWRIKNDYTRSNLSEKLELTPDQLLCIESGIALLEDISKTHLLALQSLLSDTSLDRKLNEQIEVFLTWLNQS